MRLHTGLALVLISLAVHAQAADSDALQGKWTIVSVMRDGKPVEALVNGVREFAGDKYTVTPKSGDKSGGAFTVNASAKPKTIDMTADSGQFKGKTLLGIYSLEGDNLTICFASPDKPRPTAFASPAGTGLYLVVHKKAK